MPQPEINKNLRLSDNQYYTEKTKKTNICLHHTCGSSARSTFDWWQRTPDRVATAYIVERDGNIYEVFPPECWAHHLGLSLSKNTLYNKRCIGIELASEGPLRSGFELNNRLGYKKFDEEWLYAFDIDKKPFRNATKKFHGVKDNNKYMDLIFPFRGYWYFAAYEEAQVKSVLELVNYLCDKFNIPRQLIPYPDKLDFVPEILDTFKGIYTHVNVRKDKDDLSPAFDWDLLEESLKK